MTNKLMKKEALEHAIKLKKETLEFGGDLKEIPIELANTIYNYVNSFENENIVIASYVIYRMQVFNLRDKTEDDIISMYKGIYDYITQDPERQKSRLYAYENLPYSYSEVEDMIVDMEKMADFIQPDYENINEDDK